MKVFVFDTETTGFINKKESSLIKQPHIIQFAGILGDFTNGEFKEEKRIDVYINPGIPIPYSSSLVHNIYNIDIQDKKNIEYHIEDILYHINIPDIIIGHNVEYDEEMVKLELKRLGREYDYRPKQVMCTMKTTVDFCAIKGNGERYKYPKLGELYKTLFGEYFVGAHNAIIDVENTLKCFVELVNKGVLHVEEKKETIMSLF
ncbi:MAG: 3'-5' exonuclease [Candidatus Gracilibacteria bacterium]|nr:3'-5' exonuclease [Candidatus Gracilibacteria bacterium]